ncbi:Acetylornithine aminotransferase [compost metagenome]
MLTLGKGIGGGFPLSAMLTKSEYDLFEPGDQGGTYSGAPLAMAAGIAVLKELLKRNLAGNAEQQGNYLISKLQELSSQYPISNIRGKGLLLAFDVPEGMATELAAACMSHGLLINAPRPSTIRLVPPLIVTKSDIDDMLGILQHAFSQTSL